MKAYLLILFSFFILGCSGQPSNIDSPDLVKTTGVTEVSPAAARPAVEAAYSQFIDVRSEDEYRVEHANRARNIPLETLGANLDKLEKNEPVYIICRTDNRSRQAAKILVDAGFRQAIVVTGGTEAWKAAGLPMGGPPTAINSGKLDERTRQALISALEDERKAEATYRAALAKFPDARPFSNIINAEQRHESFLLPLFAKYGVATPANQFDPAKISVPETLAEACKAGVVAETENIELYEEFLAFVQEPDIKDVFKRLQEASRDNHLPAFTRCSEGGGGRGRGPGPARRPN